MQLWSSFRQWLVWASILFSTTSAEQSEAGPPPATAGAATPSKELLPKDSLLLISTLDGTLHAVSKRTGIVQWKLEEEPVLHVPMESTTTIKGPTFLPDPHDGSLYAYDPSSQGLTKMPFTIPELVQASPCKSSDGILYTGRKQDVWYAINPSTGVKQQVITTNEAIDKCPGGGGEMFIGRSEYKITMFDSKSNVMRWNVTFTDYSSHANEKVSLNYDLLHLASSADGFVITVDRESGRILWAENYGYPVVAMYAWVPEGLQKVEMTSVARETMTYLLRQADGKVSYWDTLFQGNPRFQPKEATLVSSLYVGQYQHSLYALPTRRHDGVQLNKYRNIQMLPGPEGSGSSSTDLEVRSVTVPVWRVLGYHKTPPFSKVTLPQTYQPAHHIQQIGSDPTPPQQVIQSELEPQPIPSRKFPDEDPEDFFSSLYPRNPDTSATRNNSGDDNLAQIRWNEITFVAILTSVITGALIFCLLKGFGGNRFVLNYFYGETFQKSPFALHNDSNPTQYDGLIRVGRITVDPVDILGRGSEGTIVYGGRFDGRNVAVKRVVPECFSFADREVALLRESDEHSHVVRYFCMERDPQFQYIALELCSNTLQEYVENPRYKCSTGLDTTTVLHQAMMGLDHLHSLKIVHRDVKPSNILISVPGKLGKQRVVISDFGLCKKLVSGRVSFSHRSGKAGTEGWIAPEMILDKKYRMTQAVDIFSMGCVFFYVICGKHPFGDSITRQSRIVNGEYSLDEIHTFEYAEEAMDTIRRMLLIDPSLRPKSETILKHPLFWDSIKKLQFFEDVSDRIEKEAADSITMQKLDNCSTPDARNGLPRDWIQYLCKPLQDDLPKFRIYKAGSVRDLLRAIRNKKHHYRELPDDVKLSLGSVPDEYLNYFTSRFPRLLIHTYLAMSCCRHEPTLRAYYGEMAQDHLFDGDCQFYDDVDVDCSIFAKHEMQASKGTRKVNKYTGGGDYSPRRTKAPKSYSAADKDPNWRSGSGRYDSPLSPSSNAFNTLGRNSNGNRAYLNVSSNFDRKVYQPDGRKTTVADTLKVQDNLPREPSPVVGRRHLDRGDSRTVSESNSVSSESENLEKKEAKQATGLNFNSSNRVNYSNTKVSFSYAEAVGKKLNASEKEEFMEKTIAKVDATTNEKESNEIGEVENSNEKFNEDEKDVADENSHHSQNEADLSITDDNSETSPSSNLEALPVTEEPKRDVTNASFKQEKKTKSKKKRIRRFKKNKNSSLVEESPSVEDEDPVTSLALT